MWRQIFIFSEKCVGQQSDTKCLCTLNTDDCQVLCLWKQIFIVFEQVRVHWTLNKGSRQKEGKIFTLCVKLGGVWGQQNLVCEPSRKVVLEVN